MAPYGVTANTIMPGADTRLAQIGWRTERSIEADGGTQQARDLRDPVHVAELGCFLASPEAAGISGQTFQVHGGTIEHVGTWRVERTWHRDDRGFTADELAAELPLDTPAKVADKPPAEWSAAREPLTRRATERAACEVAVVDRAVGEARHDRVADPDDLGNVGRASAW